MIYIAIHLAVLILFYRFILWINTREDESCVTRIPDSDNYYYWRIDVYRFGVLKKTKYKSGQRFSGDWYGV